MLRHSSSETGNAPPRKDSTLIKEVKLRILKEGIFDKEILEDLSKFSVTSPESQVSSITL